MKKLFFEEDLPSYLKNGEPFVDWVNSVGKEVRFIFNDIQDKLSIINYSSKDSKVTIKYKDFYMIFILII